MNQINSGSKFGIVLGGIGGILAMIELARFCDFSSTGAVVTLSSLLLIAVMFFALAGAFSKNSPWTSQGMTLFAFLTAAIVVGVTIVDYVELLFGVAEVVVAVLIVLVGYSPATKRFLTKQ